MESWRWRFCWRPAQRREHRRAVKSSGQQTRAYGWEVQGRELAGAKGTVAAHSTGRVAWLADRQRTVLEALFLVTPQEADAPGRLDQRPRRPQGVHCTRSETEAGR